MGSPVCAAEDETVQLHYIQWQDDFIKQKPYEVISECPDDLKQCNFTLRPGPDQTIHDMRGRESDFDLDRNGFQVRPHSLNAQVFDEETIKQDYIPSMEMFLKKTVDPDGEVYIFDWRVR